MAAFRLLPRAPLCLGFALAVTVRGTVRQPCPPLLTHRANLVDTRDTWLFAFFFSWPFSGPRHSGISLPIIKQSAQSAHGVRRHRLAPPPPVASGQASDADAQKSDGAGFGDGAGVRDGMLGLARVCLRERPWIRWVARGVRPEVLGVVNAVQVNLRVVKNFLPRKSQSQARGASAGKTKTLAGASGTDNKTSPVQALTARLLFKLLVAGFRGGGA